MDDYSRMTKAELVRRLSDAYRVEQAYLAGGEPASSEFVPVKELLKLKAALDAPSIVAITDAGRGTNRDKSMVIQRILIEGNLLPNRSAHFTRSLSIQAERGPNHG